MVIVEVFPLLPERADFLDSLLSLINQLVESCDLRQGPQWLEIAAYISKTSAACYGSGNFSRPCRAEVGTILRLGLLLIW